MKSEIQDTPFADSYLRRIWEDCADTPFSYSDERSLNGFRKKMFPWKRIAALSSAAVACAAGLVAAGFFVGRNIPCQAIPTTILSCAQSGEGQILPDGSVVHLNAGSSISYGDLLQDAACREVTLSGQAFFDVARDEKRPFVVKMGDVSLEVLGTSFDASAYASDQIERIALRSGSVKVSIPQQEDQTLSPGECLTYSHTDGKAEVSSIDPLSIGRWRENTIVFENETLENVFFNLESRYRVSIVNRSTVSPDTRISLAVTNEDVDSMMDILSIILHLGYRQYDNTIIFTDK